MKSSALRSQDQYNKNEIQDRSRPHGNLKNVLTVNKYRKSPSRVSQRVSSVRKRGVALKCRNMRPAEGAVMLITCR